MPTYIAAVQEIADQLSLRERGSLTAAAATALTAANYPFRDNRTDADSERYVGAEIYITSGAVPVPNPNGVGNFAASTGVFTPSNTYTTVPDTTASFDLYLRGVRIRDIRDAVIVALRRLRYVQAYPISLVDDPDMDATGTTSWAATNATLTKVTTSPNVLIGQRSLRVVATAALGQAQSVSARVPDGGAGYVLSATCRAATGTARLTLYDVTNGTVLGTDDWAGSEWGTLTVAGTAPSTSRAVAARLISVANADDVYWDHVVLVRDGQHSYPLPSWVTSPSQVRDMLLLPFGKNPFDHGVFTKHFWFSIVRDTLNPNNPMRIQFSPAPFRVPWFIGARPFATPSVDSDEITVDLDWVVAAGTVELLRRLVLKPNAPSAWSAELKMRRNALRKMNAEMMPASRLVFTMSEPY